MSKAFTVLNGVIAALPLINVDTDMIIPKQYLKTIKRTGLGVYLFDEMRRDLSGKEITDFVLNRADYRDASVLVSGENFGCGSSREHAPWALSDFGIRCIIAPSYADIFYNNCFKNGMLPIVLTKDEVAEITKFAESGRHNVTVDLDKQTVVAGGKTYSFSVDAFRKHCLLNGLDDIGLTLQHEAKITQFEAAQKAKLGWQYA